MRSFQKGTFVLSIAGQTKNHATLYGSSSGRLSLFQRQRRHFHAPVEAN